MNGTFVGGVVAAAVEMALRNRLLLLLDMIYDLDFWKLSDFLYRCIVVRRLYYTVTILNSF